MSCAGPTLDVPHTVTPQQLEVLLNGLLANEEKQPYSFYIDGQVRRWCCCVCVFVLQAGALCEAAAGAGATCTHLRRQAHVARHDAPPRLPTPPPPPPTPPPPPPPGAWRRAGRAPGAAQRVCGAVAAHRVPAAGRVPSAARGALLRLDARPLRGGAGGCLQSGRPQPGHGLGRHHAALLGPQHAAAALRVQGGCAAAARVVGGGGVGGWRVRSAAQGNGNGRRLSRGGSKHPPQRTLVMLHVPAATPTLHHQGHRNWVLCVAWSPDGAMVASGDMDGHIWLWDPKTGQPLGSCKGHSKWITSLVSGKACAAACAARWGGVRAGSGRSSACTCWVRAVRACRQHALAPRPTPTRAPRVCDAHTLRRGSQRTRRCPAGAL